MLLKWLDIYKQKQKQKQKQAARDDLEADPHNWFRKRYSGGVRNVPDNASKTNSADTDTGQDK